MHPHTVRRIGAALSPRNGFGYASFLAFLHFRNFGPVYIHGDFKEPKRSKEKHKRFVNQACVNFLG
jgi:hypothetical protein